MRDKVPPEVFKKPYTNPVNGNPEALRNNLREAVRLFKEAGYEVRDQQMVNSKTGEPFAVEFLAADPNFERVFLFYKPSLDRLGLSVTVRTVDEAQYVNWLRGWVTHSNRQKRSSRPKMPTPETNPLLLRLKNSSTA